MRRCARWAGLAGVSMGLWVGAASEAVAQRSPAVAEVRLDVNGDGKPDVIRVEDPAAVSVSITGARKASVWKPFTTAGKVVDGSISVGTGAAYRGATVIVAEARFGRGAEGRAETIVLAWSKKRFTELWRGAVGLQGQDREWSLHVTTSDHGLLRYQGKPGVTRCDGAPVYAFLERWDWSRGEFRPVKGNLVRVDDAAPTLVAERTGAAVVAPRIFRRGAVSSALGASSARELSPPRELVDGRLDTAWREGAPAYGRGEVITFRSAVPGSKVAALRFVPGDAVSQATFVRQNRLRRFAVLIGSAAHWVELAADPADAPARFAEPYQVTFDPPVAADCVSIVLDQVYPERSPGQTAIAELAVLTAAELDPAGLYPALAEQIAGGGLAGDSAQKTLRGGGEAAARALLAAVAAGKRTAAERQRLRLAMTGLDVPAIIPELIAGLATPGTDEPIRARFAERLARFGPSAIGPLGALVATSDAAPGAISAAVTALGSIDHDAAAETLIAAAAHPRKELRRAVGLALAAHSTRVARLLEVTADADERRRATAWRALGLIAQRNDAERAAITAPMAQALAAGGGYELRYRLYDAAGAVGDDALTGALGRALAAESEPALLRVAAASLSTNTSAPASALLASLVAHRDPGVRGRAARALAERDHAASDAPLAAVLAGDGWPHVRLAAAAALGQRCRRAAPAQALVGALDGDDDARVRLTALASLVECDAPGITERLATIAGDRTRDPELRARACLYYGAAGDGTRAPRLIELFGNARNEALGGQSAALRVAAACAAALGNVGHASVTPVLARAAGDAAFPEIQAAAAVALGTYCPAEARTVLSQLAGSPERQVSLAAKAAFRRCFR